MVRSSFPNALHDVFIVIVALLLEKEPSNLQAQSLDQLISKGSARGMRFHLHTFIQKLGLTRKTDSYIGMAIVGGAAAVGTLLLAGLIRRARK